ncbi:MAG: hypothetical protein U0821_17865 [Chloroflexota bacterium]
MLATHGLDLLKDGQPTKLWGVRLANALEDDEHAGRVIDALDDYADHGVNAVTWFLQGGSSGAANAVREDGSLDPAYANRMHRLLDAAVDREMITVVGIFYQGRRLLPRTARAVERAVESVAKWLLPYRDVIVNVANEYHASAYDRVHQVYPFGDPAAINHLIDVVRHADPERLVGANAKQLELVLPVARHANVALHDDPGLSEQLLLEHGVGKPVIDVECGGFAFDMGRPGVFTAGEKLFHLAQIRSAASLRGKSVFFHAHWFQEPPRRFDLGGYGDEQDRGVHWYFDMLAELLNLDPCKQVLVRPPRTS